MKHNTGILYACTIKDDGEGKSIPDENVSELVRSDELSWVHLDGNTEQARDWLNTELPYLDGIIIDALLADTTRPRILEFESGILVILRGVNLNQDASPEDMVSIRLWVDEHRIISVQRRDLRAVKDIQRRLEVGSGPKSSGEFVSMLVSRLFERMEPALTQLDEQLDDIEELIIEVPDIKERQNIIQLRKQAIIFRRYIAPQRDVISYLRVCELPWLGIDHKRRLQESLDRIIRYVEDLETIRERAHIVNDELDRFLAERLNKNMFVLSVIAAIFLPLSFLTGLFGINVGGIPGAQTPYAFYIFVGVLLIILGLQAWWFKRLKWF